MELTDLRKESLITVPLDKIRAEFPSTEQNSTSKDFFTNLLKTIEENVIRCKQLSSNNFHFKKSSLINHFFIIISIKEQIKFLELFYIR